MEYTCPNTLTSQPVKNSSTFTPQTPAPAPTQEARVGPQHRARPPKSPPPTYSSSTMPRLEEWEIKKYWEIFQGLKPENNTLTGDRVSPVLKNLRLPEPQLARIWDLSDIDADGKLDFEEFCITMRLIFDLVNGSMSDVPAELPAWLVPQLKRHLIDANQAVASGNNSGARNGASAEEEDVDTLSDAFDWYILPTDKATYEAIYNSNSDTYGRVRFEALEGLYHTLAAVPRTDILLAWNLVNPKQFETIDKDQVLVFLHILNQRENGKRIPRGVPALLRATFSKEVPRYDLSEVQRVDEPSANDKGAFGARYLSKVGQGHSARPGTDFSATEGTDWEEVRLRRELEEAEALLARAQEASGSSGGVNGASQSGALRFEFEQLLKHKQERLAQARRGGDRSLDDVRSDVELIAAQVQTLEEFLAGKQSQLAELRQQL